MKTTQLFNEWKNSDLESEKTTLQDAFDAGYSCGAKWESEKWHDLTKDPNDLPVKVTKRSSRLCLVARKSTFNGKFVYELGRYDYNQEDWKNTKDDYIFDVIAWINFPAFTEESNR